MSEPEVDFAELCAAYAGTGRITLPSGSGAFGGSALKVDGLIFAMLVRDRIVLKLPAPRVAELIGAGLGEPFDASKGPPMREWVVLADGTADLRSLADEALSFVGGRPG